MDLMNPVDIGIAVIIAFCVIRGIFRGFIKEIFSLIGALAGFYIACIYYPDVAKLLIKWAPRLPYENIIGFILIFIGIYILINLLGVGIKFILNIVFLGWVDRVCGILFGAAKGMLIVSMILLVLTAFVPEFGSMIKSSRMAPVVTRFSEQMIRVVPPGMKQQFIDKIEVFKKEWQKKK
jgi:membrane protein required for colicin V production